MAQAFTTTLLASTYNWPEALELLLESVLRQDTFPDEVLIADDGSTAATQKLIADYQKKMPVPLRHIWHEDHGNRKAVILNKALATSTAAYIIEVDGDVILHPSFIKDHIRFAEKGHYLYGSRVNIQQNFLPKLFSEKPLTFNWYHTGIKKRGRALHLPLLMRWAKVSDRRSSKLRGCNLSFWREDFIAINGYNENFSGWGMEDSEMVERLHNIGIRGKRLKFAGILYHIFHKEQSKERVSLNKKMEAETVSEKLKYAENGIAKYLS